jgi:hypothetical protein
MKLGFKSQLTFKYLRCGGGLIRQLVPELNNDLHSKLIAKADRYSSSGTTVDSTMTRPEKS